MSEAAKPESERRKFRAIKGTRDILPPQTALWNWFEATARSVMESYNFHEIRLPIFEETDLFVRSIGGETDVVNKEMYSFAVGGIQERQNSLEELVAAVDREWERGAIDHTDENEQRIRKIHDLYESVRSNAGTATAITNQLESVATWSSIYQIYHEIRELALKVTLRPEATASVCRAYIEHGMHTLPGDVKLYYIGPMFRRERPQKGRYRQFYQIGAEVLGASDAPAIDAEVVEMLLVFFRRVGLAGTTLYVNSIGCGTCRPQYVELLRAELQKVKGRLGPDSQRRIETNPLRVFDSKLPEEQAVIETLPRISDHLCSACREHFAKLKEELKLRRIEYKESWRLVRGLDYYTRTTFEVTAAGLGSQDAICGGGRYDGLVELLGGPSGIKGIGFAIGTDRAILSIQETGNAPGLRDLDVFVAWMGAGAYGPAVRLARKLREAGFSVEIPPEEMRIKKSLGLAGKLGARYALIIGEDEIASARFTLKRLVDGEQKKLGEPELLAYLQSEPKR